ncbi:MAG: hypothetical protein AVDCRST_MAG10-3748, partial [uncultured Acidimicrobiales bacterium]
WIETRPRSCSPSSHPRRWPFRPSRLTTTWRRSGAFGAGSSSRTCPSSTSRVGAARTGRSAHRARPSRSRSAAAARPPSPSSPRTRPNTTGATPH